MSRLRNIGRIFLILGLVGAAVAWAVPQEKKGWTAPEEAKELRNPVPPTEAALHAGKDLYLDKCAQCHGQGGKGDGPMAAMSAVQPGDFTDSHMSSEMTDGEIFWKISEGRPPMLSFKKQLTEEQRWQLVDYLRSFAPKPAKAPAKSAPHKH